MSLVRSRGEVPSISWLGAGAVSNNAINTARLVDPLQSQCFHSITLTRHTEDRRAVTCQITVKIDINTDTAQPGMKEEECFVYPTLVTLTSYYSRLLPRHTSANNGYIPLKWLVKFTSAIIKQICKNYCSTFSG